jgi:hypothetical protein
MTVLSGCATGVPAEPSKLKKREIPAEKRLSPARGTAHKICLPNYGGAKLRRIRCLRDLPEPACQNHARTANAAGDIRQCCGESTPIRLLGGDEVHMPNDTQPIFCRACGKIATINARSFETRAAVGWLVIDVTTPEGPTKDCYCPEHKGSVFALLRRQAEHSVLN